MVEKLRRKGKPTLLVVMLIASSSMENSMEVLKTATLWIQQCHSWTYIWGEEKLKKVQAP